MGTLRQNVRYTARVLTRNPGFTIIAVLSLAVGIGVNTAVFSAFNAVLLRELPVHAPRELHVLHWVGRVRKDKPYSLAGEEGIGIVGAVVQMRWGLFSYPMYCAFRDYGQGCSEVFGFARTDALTVVARGRGFKAQGLLVTANFFTGYGTSTRTGRTITAEDDQPAAQPVTVITHRAWQRYFGMDPNVIGQTVMLSGNDCTIVGVLPRSHVGPLIGDEADFYVPLRLQPRLKLDYSMTSLDHYWLQVMVRVCPGPPEAQAKASLEGLWHQYMRDHLDEGTPSTLLFLDGRRGPVLARQFLSRTPLRLMYGGGLVLLIACVNLAGLLLARNAAREHEIAIRAALGAGRWRLIGQSLAESLTLSLTGAVLGLVIAWWGNSVLEHLLPSFLPGSSQIHEEARFDVRIDSNVLAFALGAVFLTALLVGLLPGLLAARVNPGARLQSTRVRGGPHLGLGKILVVGQIAMSLVLATGTGLLLRSLSNLRNVELGFDPENLLVFHLNAADAGYEDAQRTRFYEDVNEAVAAIPGVRRTAFADLCHIGTGCQGRVISVPERSIQEMVVNYMIVSDSLLATLGIPLLRGRSFSVLDAPGPVRAALVNQAFCQSVFPGQDPVGRFFKVGDRDHQVVGVCGNASYDQRENVTPMMYLSYRQAAVPEMWFAVRTAAAPLTLAPQVRTAVAVLNPLIPLTVTTQTALCDLLLLRHRVFASLGVFFTLLVVGLGCLGIYSLMAHNVALRTGEIGIRMALGARPQDVSRAILREAVLLAAVGVGIGVPLALVAVRIIRYLLYGVTSYDPVTLAVAVIMLLGVALLAAWLPARRAAGLDPMAALRCE
jgi:predicted permease